MVDANGQTTPRPTAPDWLTIARDAFRETDVDDAIADPSRDSDN